MEDADYIVVCMYVSPSDSCSGLNQHSPLHVGGWGSADHFIVTNQGNASCHALLDCSREALAHLSCTPRLSYCTANMSHRRELSVAPWISKWVSIENAEKQTFSVRLHCIVQSSCMFLLWHEYACFMRRRRVLAAVVSCEKHIGSHLAP